HPAADERLADELEQRDQPIPPQRGRAADLLAHARRPLALALAGRRALRRLLRARSRDRRRPARPPRYLIAGSAFLDLVGQAAVFASRRAVDELDDRRPEAVGSILPRPVACSADDLQLPHALGQRIDDLLGGPNR